MFLHKLIQAGRLLAAGLFLGLVTCGGGDMLKVGLIVPLTGEVRTFGISARNGAMLAFEAVNVAGGIEGRQIQVFAADDRNDPAETGRMGATMIAAEGVVAMMGSVSSDCAEALAIKCQGRLVPMITPTATSPKITVDPTGERRSCVFRACFTDPFQGKVAARFVRDSLKLETAVVMYCPDKEYSAGLAEYFTESFEELGGRVLASEEYDDGVQNFAGILNRVKELGPDLLFLPDYYNVVGTIARQARELGVRAQLVGGDGWDSPHMDRIAGSAIHGGYFTNHFSAADPRPEVQQWVASYQAKYGREPDALATLYYDAALLLAEAMRRAARPETEDICIALTQIQDFPCVTGRVSFDEWGNPIKSAVVLRYTAEGQQYVATVTP
ncbi:MAG: ABC transporter substrate-binding protein [candidate division WOR-3 bacterium]|nr:MAG: ABC transporter substrate-binding protein [candidate division WOR-3 bacterium]